MAWSDLAVAENWILTFTRYLYIYVTGNEVMNQ